jgi:magnesium-transporting ATPase (P-type)
MIGKLLGAATVGGTLASVGLLHRFLVASAQIMILVIVSAFMLCASLLCAFAIFYFCLVQFGTTPYVALIILGVTALLVTIACVALTLDQFRQLRSFHHRHLHGHGNNIPDIANIAAAFIDGFLNKNA